MATPQTEQPPSWDLLPSLRFVRSGADGVRAFNEGKEYSESFQGRSGDFSEEPHWPFCVPT